MVRTQWQEVIAKSWKKKVVSDRRKVDSDSIDNDCHQVTGAAAMKTLPLTVFQLEPSGGHCQRSRVFANQAHRWQKQVALGIAIEMFTKRYMPALSPCTGHALGLTTSGCWRQHQ